MTKYSTEVRVRSQLVISQLGRGDQDQAQQTVDKMSWQERAAFRNILQQANNLLAPRYVEGVSDEMGG